MASPYSLPSQQQLAKQMQGYVRTGNTIEDPLAPDVLKKRLDDNRLLHHDELYRWKAIEEIFSPRIKQGNSFLGREVLRFYNNLKYHTSSMATIVNKTSSQLMSLAIPIKERGVRLTVKGDILKNNDPDGKIAQGLSDFSREVIEQFYSPKSGVHREMVAACKDLMIYGNAAISDNWTDDGFRANAMDFTRLIIETDPADNSIAAIFRERAPSISSSIEYEIWMRNPKGRPGVVDLRDKKSYPYLYLRTDFGMKILRQEPLLTMPIHYLRLYTIPGYPYGKGYGEELLGEGQSLHSFRAAFDYAALLSLNPPIFLNALGVKDADKLESGLKPGQVVISQMQAIANMPLITPITQYNINEIAAFAPYEAHLEMAVSKATMEEYYSLPKTTNMTTGEVAQRVDEITSVLAGPISGLNKEYVISVVENIKTYLVAAEPATFVNRGLADIDINISIRTRYDEQQDLLPASKSLQAIQIVQSVMQTNPEIMDLIKMDDLVREALTLSGCDAKFMRSDDEMGAIRADRAEQQRQQQQAQVMAQVAQAEGL